MNENVRITHVWRINKKLVVADTIKEAIDVYCEFFGVFESYIESVVRIDAMGDYDALASEDLVKGAELSCRVKAELVNPEAEEAQP